MARVAVFDVTPFVAVIVTDAGAETRDVEIENVAWVEPAKTNTADGTEARVGSVLVSSTSTPPAGATLVSATVPSVVLLPMTVGGAMLRDANVIVAGSIVIVDDLVVPLRVAETTTVVEALTTFVVREAVPAVDPAGTMSVADGTMASSLEVIAMAAPV